MQEAGGRLMLYMVQSTGAWKSASGSENWHIDIQLPETDTLETRQRCYLLDWTSSVIKKMGIAARILSSNSKASVQCQVQFNKTVCAMIGLSRVWNHAEDVTSFVTCWLTDYDLYCAPNSTHPTAFIFIVIVWLYEAVISVWTGRQSLPKAHYSTQLQLGMPCFWKMGR